MHLKDKLCHRKRFNFLVSSISPDDQDDAVNGFNGYDEFDGRYGEYLKEG